MGNTQYGLPMVIDSLSDDTARGLKRVRFERGKGDGYTERWIQTLISRYPNMLPIEQIEPALTPAIPVCMELPLKSGSVDNLYVTPDGYLIVGETKLFRNPEARREVVGQLIDYAKDLSALSYEALDQAVRKAEAPGGNGGRARGLYETVASVGGGEEVAEEQFIDSVSRNLERGRLLLLIIGDGIQQGAENIASFFQQHAGMHFTLGIVELAVFELPAGSGGYLVQSRILTRTKNIDRGIVTIENGNITVKPPPAQVSPTTGPAKRTTISEEKFYEELATRYPGVVSRLKEFTAQLETVGIVTEFGQGSMILRGRSDGGRGWNLGAISIGGKVWTGNLDHAADAIGHLDLSHNYLNRLVEAVPGAYIKNNPDTLDKGRYWCVNKGSTYVTIDVLLEHEDAWRAAIAEFMEAISHALEDQE